jgi:hypothetical protein
VHKYLFQRWLLEFNVPTLAALDRAKVNLKFGKTWTTMMTKTMIPWACFRILDRISLDRDLVFVAV